MELKSYKQYLREALAPGIIKKLFPEFTDVETKEFQKAWEQTTGKPNAQTMTKEEAQKILDAYRDKQSKKQEIKQQQEINAPIVFENDKVVIRWIKDSIASRKYARCENYSDGYTAWCIAYNDDKVRKQHFDKYAQDNHIFYLIPKDLKFLVAFLIADPDSVGGDGEDTIWDMTDEEKSLDYLKAKFRTYDIPWSVYSKLSKIKFPPNLYHLLIDECQKSKANINKVKELLDKGANYTKDEYLCIRLAIKNNNLELVKLFASKVANRDIFVHFLSIILEQKNTEMLREVVSYLKDSASSWVLDKNSIELHRIDKAIELAIRLGEDEMVDILKDFNDKNELNRSLVRLVDLSDTEGINMLLSKGADPNFFNGRALRDAAVDGKLKIVKLLLPLTDPKHISHWTIDVVLSYTYVSFWTSSGWGVEEAEEKVNDYKEILSLLKKATGKV